MDDDTTSPASVHASASLPPSPAARTPALSASHPNARASETGPADTARALPPPKRRRVTFVSKTAKPAKPAAPAAAPAAPAENNRLPASPLLPSRDPPASRAARAPSPSGRPPSPQPMHAPANRSPAHATSSSKRTAPSSAKHTQTSSKTRDARRPRKPAPVVEEDSADEWFAIKDIVAEKTVRGALQYYVDWANHAVTGESYPKSWIPAADASLEAVKDWEKIKRARKEARKQQARTKARTNPSGKATKTAPAKKTHEPAPDPESACTNSSAALTSQSSRALTPPPATPAASSQASHTRQPSASPAPEPSRKRLASSEKENEDADESAQPRRKRRLVQGVRPDKSPALDPPIQSQPLPSSPPTTREHSIDLLEALAAPALAEDDDAHSLVAGPAVPVAAIDITPGPDFDPNDYARLSQLSQLSQVSQIPRLALQSQGWMRPQSAVSQRRCSSSSDRLESTEPPAFPSGRTIPDSQQETDDTEELQAPGDKPPRSADPLHPSDAEDPSYLVAAAEPSQHAAAHQPAARSASTTGCDAQPVPAPAASQDHEQLRASVEWASDEPASPPFLTQPEPDFCLLTQLSPLNQLSHQDQPSDAPRRAKTPTDSSAANSHPFSTVSAVPDSARPGRVDPALPRPTTPSSFVYHAPEAVMDDQQPAPSVETPGDDAGLAGISSMSGVHDDPLLLAEIQRMQQEGQGASDDASHPMDDPLVLAEIERQQQENQENQENQAGIGGGSIDSIGSSGIDDPLVLAEIQRMQCLVSTSSPGLALPASQHESLGDSGSSSNILPLPMSSHPHPDPLSAESALPTVEPALPAGFEPVSSSMAGVDASLLAPDPYNMLGQDPTVVPGAQHIGGAMDDVGDAHPGTITPSDLSFADPMATGGLDLSPEPEAEHEHPLDPLAGMASFAAGQDHSDTGADGGEDEDEAEDAERAEMADSNGDGAGPGEAQFDQPPSPSAMEEDADEQEHEHERAEQEDDEDDEHELLPPNPNLTTNSYVLTLPLASNTRQYYIDLIMDKHTKQTIKDFSRFFSGNVFHGPDANVIAPVDELLRKLLDLSDLPTFSDSLPPMTPEVMMKHAVDTNSKFSFVYEFLDGIATLDKKVLILGRKGAVLDYLEAVVSASGIKLDRFRAESYLRPSVDARSRERRMPSFSVILADTAEMSEALAAVDGPTDTFPQPTDFDIVIGFDHSARTSGLLAYFLSQSDDRRYQVPKPVGLLLVSTLTLEHVDLRLELDSVDDLERKNALLLCMLECLPLLRDAYDATPAKPHEAAEAFAKMMADPSKALDWRPTPLPEEVFDIYIHSSEPASQPTFTQQETINGGRPRTRKRPWEANDEEGDGSSTPKRARIHEVTSPIVGAAPLPYSDTVKQVLAGLRVPDVGADVDVDIDAAGMPVALAQLEALAAKVVDLEAQLQDKESLGATLTERVRTLDRLVQGHAATINECQTKLLAAVKERGVFEVERDAAAKEAVAAKEKYESRTATLAELRADKKALETRLAEADGLLAGSSQPDVAELGTMRTALQAAEDKAATLERKLANTKEELEYAQRAYQDASNAAAEMSAENRDLGARVKELERLAADNLRAIHATQNRNELEAYRAQWAEAVTMLGERERDLEWVREELRVLKNGRRETRQQSVPRSPRLSVISPRTVGRGGSAGGGGGGTGGGGGSSSASATPVPGVLSAPPAGAGFAMSARTSVSRGNSPVSATFDASVHNGLAASGNGGGPPVAGMTYLNPSQGGGGGGGGGSSRFNHFP